MKKVVFGGVALSLAATLLYLLLVWYYAFVKADPWGVERYLVMRGGERREYSGRLDVADSSLRKAFEINRGVLAV